MIRLSLVTTFAAAALLSLSTGGLAAVTNCGTAPKKILVAQSDAGQSTSSVNFVDVIGSEVNFNVPGADITSSTCVLIDFSAQASAPAASNAMVAQAVLDNVLVSRDGNIQFVANTSNSGDAHAYNFLFEDVRPGLHSVKMRYRSLLPGISVSIVRFDMVVHHK